MIDAAWPLVRAGLHRLDPERAHDLTLAVLGRLPLPAPAPDDPSLAVRAFGLEFPNPVGLAAGFDKNGVVAHKVAALGFGFNNAGQFHAVQALRPAACVLGVNIGANKDATDRVSDYVGGIHAFAGKADYFAINVSSPNTPNLRDLQQPAALDDLLARVLEARDTLAGETSRKPVLLKIAPDLSLAELDGIVAVARARRIDGMIVSNTTVTRPGAVATRRAGLEPGGLSGRPLFALSTRMLAETFLRVERQFPLIGVGGIENAATALAKIEAGANLVQLYSALVFQGPGLVGAIKRGLVGKPLAALVGAKATAWAKGEAKV